LPDVPILIPLFAADAAEKPSGISALGLDFKSFVFQLITFVIVLLILRKYVFTRLVATLEKRRSVLEASLVQAKKIEEALKSAEHKAAEVLKAARDQADQALSDAAKQAQGVIAAAELGGAKRAERIVKDAEQHLAQEREKLRAELKGELVDLVAAATEKVIEQKLDGPSDAALIKRSIDEVRS
jgi:F-type H+-transporting ATPase subunit b